MDVKQNTQEWLEMRKKYIGASDAPIIMGVSPWRTPYQLWQEKLGLIDSQPENFAMQRGKELEEEARLAYQKMTGLIVVPKVVFHPNKPFMMSSLDGLTLDGNRAVEIKCPNEHDHELARSGKIPEKYYPQVMHHLAGNDHPIEDYFSYRKGEGIIVEVPRDQDYIDKLMEKEEKFWDKVISFEMPELTDMDFRQKDEDWILKAQQLYDRKQELKALKKEVDALEKKFREECQGNPCMGGGYKYQKYMRVGSVSYSKIPELIGVDLSSYRGPPIEIWTLINKA